MDFIFYITFKYTTYVNPFFQVSSCSLRPTFINDLLQKMEGVCDVVTQYKWGRSMMGGREGIKKSKVVTSFMNDPKKPVEHHSFKYQTCLKADH